MQICVIISEFFKAQNEALTHEVNLYQQTAESTQKELFSLNNEVTTLRAKYGHVNHK